LGGKSGAQKLNSLLCGRVWVRLGQYFHRYPIVVADVSEDPKNLAERNVSPSRGKAIRIGYVDIAYEIAGREERIAKRSVFNIHVEGVRHQPRASPARFADKLEALSAVVDEVHFVPIHRFHEQLHTERFSNISAAAYAIDIALASHVRTVLGVNHASDSTYIHLGVEFCRETNHVDYSFDGTIANHNIGVCEIQVICRENLTR
jgi:hypothetical protein